MVETGGNVDVAVSVPVVFIWVVAVEEPCVVACISRVVACFCVDDGVRAVDSVFTVLVDDSDVVRVSVTGVVFVVDSIVPDVGTSVVVVSTFDVGVASIVRCVSVVFSDIVGTSVVKRVCFVVDVSDVVSVLGDADVLAVVVTTTVVGQSCSSSPSGQST